MVLLLIFKSLFPFQIDVPIKVYTKIIHYLTLEIMLLVVVALALTLHVKCSTLVWINSSIIHFQICTHSRPDVKE